MFRTLSRSFINMNMYTRRLYAPSLSSFCARSSDSHSCALIPHLKFSSAAMSLCQQSRGTMYGIHGTSPQESHSSMDPESEDLRGLGKLLTRDAAWSVRLANENGYLSWCRNGYLCSAVGVMMTAQTVNHMIGQYAASGSFLVSGLNLTIGTVNYIYQLLALRHLTQMSLPTTILYVILSLVHLCAWGMVIVLFIENQDNIDNMQVIDIDANEFGSENKAQA